MNSLEILDDLGYNLMFKTDLNDYEHEIQFYIGPDHKECYFSKRYPHKTLRAHCSLCYKNFCKTCLQTVLKIDFPDFKKENYYGNKVINNKISTLETRLNQIEKTIDFFYENFEKNRTSTSIFYEEQASGLMALQNKDCIPIICNKKNNKSLHILVKLIFPKINNFDETEIVLQALVDTGCSFTSICKSVVPQHNCFRSNTITKTRTMSGDIITNDTETRNFTIQLSTNCDIFCKRDFYK